MTLAKAFIITGLSVCFLNVAGCADWQTTPTTVDRHHGMAVKNMIANQTLYPEHGQQPRQVLLIDGQKAEAIIKAYRAPVTDLRSGKESVDFDVQNRR